MNIIGPDTLVFGVEDTGSCGQFLLDYGLTQVSEQRYEALDGTGLLVLEKDDVSLPPSLPSGSSLRKTIYGVADQTAIDAIAAELGKDRDVNILPDGSLATVDDMGFALGFQVTIRKTLSLPAEIINAPGSTNGRRVNVTGVEKEATPAPRNLSHVVYFVPDFAKAERFYADRLGFVTTDRFQNVGPFMRPAGSDDHHTIFFIQTPPHMQGVEHFTFHMSGPTEVAQAGTNFVNKGYQSFWGPGRHIFGSNWFWYFKSPFGCNIEYDSDMDKHDDEWVAREAELCADNSQAFLLQYREKWVPTGPPPPTSD
jgi:catechol 2,3-dioxygenase-like lactoylglutathione lyase family enzyme